MPILKYFLVSNELDNSYNVNYTNFNHHLTQGSLISITAMSYVFNRSKLRVVLLM